MLIFMGQILEDMDGKPMEFTRETYLQTEQGTLVKREKTGQQFTLRDAVKNALLSQHEAEKNVAAEEKDKRYDLYLKVRSSEDPIDLTVEELAMLKKLIGYNPSVLVSGQCRKMLEGKKEEKETVQG